MASGASAADAKPAQYAQGDVAGSLIKKAASEASTGGFFGQASSVFTKKATYRKVEGKEHDFSSVLFIGETSNAN